MRRVVLSLAATYPTDYRNFNPEDWSNPGLLSYLLGYFIADQGQLRRRSRDISQRAMGAEI